MKRLLLAILVALVTGGSALAFLALGDPALVTAIDKRSGDVYLRLKDRRAGTGGVYRFRKTDVTYNLVGRWLFPYEEAA